MKCSYKGCKKKPLYKWTNGDGDTGKLCLYHAVYWLLSKKFMKVELL